MGLERRGRIRSADRWRNWRQEDVDESAKQAILDRQEASVRGISGGAFQGGCRRHRRRDNRAVREGFEGQPLQSLESTEFWHVLPASCTRSDHSEEERRRKNPWCS